MDNKRYRNFFYYTEKGYPSYFSQELQSALKMEFDYIISQTKGTVTKNIYLSLMKVFLEDSIKLMKNYKIRKDRIESFIKNLATNILDDCPKVQSGLKKGFMKGVNDFIDTNKMFSYDTDFTKEWHENINHQFEFGFKKVAKKVATNKIVIYLRILGFSSSDELTSSIIKKRFNKLAMTKHPDHGGNAEEFMAITEAKDYLLEVFK